MLRMNTNRFTHGGAPEVPSALNEKLNRLVNELEALGTVAIGFSGGVDSTFLAAVCAQCIPEQTVLIHLDAPFIPTPERTACERTLRRLGLAHVILPCSPLSSGVVSSNPCDRCYHCKRIGFEAISNAARRLGCHTVLEGSNADDDPATRPGTRAVRELGARSPLAELGWTKDEERTLLRAWGFDVWNMPAGACLATRIAMGEPLTENKLLVIRACEDYLHDLGIQQVRLRISREVARIATDDAGLRVLSGYNQAHPVQGTRDVANFRGGSGGPQPATTAPQPAAVASQPTVVVPQPEAIASQPAAVALQPTVAELQTATVVLRPVVAEPQPADTNPQTATLEIHPPTVEAHPATVEAHPATVALRPAVAEPQPAAANPQTATVEAHPATVEVHPAISKALLSRASGVFASVDPRARQYSMT